MQAPSLLLEDYNYFINKAVNQYINKIYNQYEVNQQKSDDLRVLKSTAVLEQPEVGYDFAAADIFSNIWASELPDDYVHILNCTVQYKVKKDYSCYNEGDEWSVGALRLTADAASQILNNHYMRPSYKRPYYYINNITVKNTFPTEDNKKLIEDKYKYIILTIKPEYQGQKSIKVDGYPIDFDDITNLREELLNINIQSEIRNKYTLRLKYEETLTITDLTGIESDVRTSSLHEKRSGIRYGNTSKTIIEIRNGKKNNIFEIEKVLVDYIKAPQYIRLTYDQVDSVEDTSQVLEFPDYVAQEIVNELIHLLMENASDPRIQTHIPVNTSIAQPQQEQPSQQRQRR